VFPAPPAPVVMARKAREAGAEVRAAFREMVELAPRVQATASDVLPVLAVAAFAPTGS